MPNIMSFIYLFLQCSPRYFHVNCGNATTTTTADMISTHYPLYKLLSVISLRLDFCFSYIFFSSTRFRFENSAPRSGLDPSRHSHRTTRRHREIAGYNVYILYDGGYDDVHLWGCVRSCTRGNGKKPVQMPPSFRAHYVYRRCTRYIINDYNI